MGRAMVAAHRGVATGAAENTIEAFTNAIAVGADMIEFDVRMTRDGELIAFHDARVNGVGVGSLTRDEIASATGVRPPLLAEVLRTCAGRIKLDVELKEDGYVPAVMAALKAALDPGEFVVTSFLPTAVDRAKTEFPEVKTGLLIGGSARWAGLPISVRELYPVDLARKVRADYLAPHYRLAKFGTVHRAAAAGLPCLLWTVNADCDIRAFAADPRVAVIITDHAERALAIVAATAREKGAVEAKQRSVQNSLKASTERTVALPARPRDPRPREGHSTDRPALRAAATRARAPREGHSTDRPALRAAATRARGSSSH